MRTLLLGLLSFALASAAFAGTKLIYAGTLAVPQDPTRDIKVMERVSFVMRGGTVFVGP